jgi:alpha-L-arabinofuranosidase
MIATSCNTPGEFGQFVYLYGLDFARSIWASRRFPYRRTATTTRIDRVDWVATQPPAPKKTSWAIRARARAIGASTSSCTSSRTRSREPFVAVLNRSKDRDLATTIVNQEGTLDSEAVAWELNHSDLKATHTVGDDRRIRPTTRTVRLAPVNGAFPYTFPAHSLTILRLKLR